MESSDQWRTDLQDWGADVVVLYQRPSVRLCSENGRIIIRINHVHLDRRLSHSRLVAGVTTANFERVARRPLTIQRPRSLHLTHHAPVISDFQKSFGFDFDLLKSYITAMHRQ